MSKTRVLTVFISAPGDVSGARAEAARRVRELNGAPGIAGRFRLEPMNWQESTPPKVGAAPQATVHAYTGRADHADIVICILGRRMGTELCMGGRAYPSGTLYEFHTAYKARQHSRSGRPVILLYRVLEDPPRPESDPQERKQATQVDAFFQKFHKPGGTYTGMYEEYRSTAAFGEALALKLREVVLKDFLPRRRSFARSPFMARGRKADSYRAEMITKVREHWVERVLKDLTGRGADAFETVFRVTDGTRVVVPAPAIPFAKAGDTLRAIYDHADHQLLIVGKAGAGKTFKLLQLTETLLDSAEEDPRARIPVVLNLSSWAANRKPLREWLISELISFYDMSPKIARRWVRGEKLVLCLDGLDEITASGAAPGSEQEAVAVRLREDCRRECLREINRYIRGTCVRMILCCRDDEYAALGVPLLTRRGDPGVVTATVEPLDDAQIESYLKADGRDLSALREAVARDGVLREMAQTPFLLMVMAVAYHDGEGVSASGILRGGGGGVDSRLTDLFEKYVAARVHLSEEEPPGEDRLPELRKYLGALAEKMEGGSKLLLVEQLQPDWLSPAGRRLYLALVCLQLILFALVLIGLPVAWAIGYELSTPGPHLQRLRHLDFKCLLLVTLCCGGSLAVGFTLFKGWMFSLAIALALGAGRAITVGMGYDGHDWPAHGLVSAALGFVVVAPIFKLHGHARDRIRPAGPSKLSGRHALGGLVAALVVGGGLWPSFGPARGLSFGLALIPVFVLCYGYFGTGFEIKSFPNQGIWRSAAKALSALLSAALVGAVCFGSIYGAFYGEVRGVVNAVLGLSLSAISLAFGFVPLMQHVSLRCALAACGLAPLRLVPFLNAAGTLHLLRRCGGGYTFEHEFVRQYFRGVYRCELEIGRR